MQRLVLAISADNADALLDGSRGADHRTLPPTRLPAKAYLAVVGTASVVGECVLGTRGRRTKDGWTLPVTDPKRYRRPRPIADYGLATIPRSFRYLQRATTRSGTSAAASASVDGTKLARA